MQDSIFFWRVVLVIYGSQPFNPIEWPAFSSSYIITSESNIKATRIKEMIRKRKKLLIFNQILLFNF